MNWVCTVLLIWSILSILILALFIRHRILVSRIVNTILQNPEMQSDLGFDRMRWWELDKDFKVLGQWIRMEIFYDMARKFFPELVSIKREVFDEYRPKA